MSTPEKKSHPPLFSTHGAPSPRKVLPDAPNALTPIASPAHGEASDASRFLQQLKDRSIRAEKVAAIKVLIEAKMYEDDAKLDVAIDRLLDELFGKFSQAIDATASMSAGAANSTTIPGHVVEDFQRRVAEQLEIGRSVNEVVLHRMNGRFHTIQGDQAIVSLVDEQGREATATCLVNEMNSYGIHYRNTFSCEIVRRGNETAVRFNPVRRLKLTPEDLHEVEAQTEQALGDYDPANDS